MVECGLNIRTNKRHLLALQLQGNRKSSSNANVNHDNYKDIELVYINDLFVTLLSCYAFILIIILFECLYYIRKFINIIINFN